MFAIYPARPVACRYFARGFFLTIVAQMQQFSALPQPVVWAILMRITNRQLHLVMPPPSPRGTAAARLAGPGTPASYGEF
jgi:hypothetical protein